MNYYRIKTIEGYDWIWSKDIELRRYALDFEGKPMHEKWQEVKVDFVDKGKRDFDICVATSPLFIFSKKAVNLLENILLKYGELLPLKSPDDNYVAYHCTNIIENSIDLEKSEIDWLDEKEGWINNVTKIVFKKELISENIIFRIPSTYSDDTFFGEEFKQIVVDNNLKGFGFSLLDLD
ncbi:hypothetical protein B4Q04_21710 [Zobellia sp. OII3]|uniref:imm11 family protein n=1 Tax=Zobellia sp. OII3 TaxID=2034520 RepID=UPI000B529690|nr:DUF1629 domain-containing protein [Zobellia sp. OII3]OWW23231.1 hypothetical protein B4Q04_21710 [Zobellia sp. OII3]